MSLNHIYTQLNNRNNILAQETPYKKTKKANLDCFFQIAG